MAAAFGLGFPSNLSGSKAGEGSDGVVPLSPMDDHALLEMKFAIDLSKERMASSCSNDDLSAEIWALYEHVLDPFDPVDLLDPSLSNDVMNPDCPVSGSESRTPDAARAKRTRSQNWRDEENLAYWKLWVEAQGVKFRGKYLWDFISQGLWNRHRFERSSKSCEDHWSTLLKWYKAIRQHEVSRRDPQTEEWTSYWDMDKDGRAKQKLPREFPREWWTMMDEILAAQGKGSAISDSAGPSDANYFRIPPDPNEGLAPRGMNNFSMHGVEASSPMTLDQLTRALNRVGKVKMPPPAESPKAWWEALESEQGTAEQVRNPFPKTISKSAGGVIYEILDNKAIRQHEFSRRDPQTEEWTSYWDMDKDGRAKQKLPREFSWEWRDPRDQPRGPLLSRVGKVKMPPPAESPKAWWEALESEQGTAEQVRNPFPKTISKSAGGLSDEILDSNYKLISQFAPIFKKQIEDVLEPILGPVASILQSHVEAEWKHQVAFLDLEEKKLAVRRQKIQWLKRRRKIQWLKRRRSGRCERTRRRATTAESLNGVEGNLQPARHG